MVPADDNRAGLVEPFAEWQALSTTERADEMRTATEFALQTPAGSRERECAAGLVIAIGNYEYLSAQDPEDSLIQAAEARLKELDDGDRSRYWG